MFNAGKIVPHFHGMLNKILRMREQELPPFRFLVGLV
jgi:hypothetical protein